MELFEAIVNRRTTNTAFDSKPVSRQDIDTLVKMASYAPSHFNSQPWRFIIIQDKNIINEIASIAGRSMKVLLEDGTFWKNYRKYFRFSKKEMDEKKTGIHIDHMPKIIKPFAKYIFTEEGGKIMAKFKVPEILGKDEIKLVSSSPLLFAICLDKDEYKKDELSGFYSVISLGAVTQNLWLSTHSLGIGMQFVSTPGEIPQEWDNITTLLGIPENFELAAIFRMGYIDKNIKRPTIDWKSSLRKGANELAWADKWGNDYRN